MTFRTIEPAPGRRVDEVSVSIARHSTRAARIRITFHKSLCEKMGWEDASKVEIMIGEGPDLGMVRFRPAKMNGFSLRRPKRGDRLMVFIPARSGTPDNWRAGSVEYGISEQSLTIRLPWHTRNGLRAAE